MISTKDWLRIRLSYWRDWMNKRRRGKSMLITLCSLQTWLESTWIQIMINCGMSYKRKPFTESIGLNRKYSEWCRFWISKTANSCILLLVSSAVTRSSAKLIILWRFSKDLLKDNCRRQRLCKCTLSIKLSEKLKKWAL